MKKGRLRQGNPWIGMKFFTSTYHHTPGNELNDVSNFPSVNPPTNQTKKKSTNLTPRDNQLTTKP